MMINRLLAAALSIATIAAWAAYAGGYTIKRQLKEDWYTFEPAYSAAALTNNYNYGGAISNTNYNHRVTAEAAASLLSIWEQYLQLGYIPSGAWDGRPINTTLVDITDGTATSSATNRAIATRRLVDWPFENGMTIFDYIGTSALVDPLTEEMYIGSSMLRGAPGDGWWTSSLLRRGDGTRAKMELPHDGSLSTNSLPQNIATYIQALPRFSTDVAADAWGIVPGGNSPQMAALDKMFANVGYAGGSSSAWSAWKQSHQYAICPPYLHSLSNDFAWAVDWERLGAATNGVTRRLDANAAAAMSQILAGLDTYVQTEAPGGELICLDGEDAFGTAATDARWTKRGESIVADQRWQADYALDLTDSYYTTYFPAAHEMQITFRVPTAMHWSPTENPQITRTATTATTEKRPCIEFGGASLSLQGSAWPTVVSNDTLAVSEQTLRDFVRAYGSESYDSATGSTEWLLHWTPRIDGGSLEPYQDLAGGVEISLNFWTNSVQHVVTNVSGRAWMMFDFAATGAVHGAWSYATATNLSTRVSSHQPVAPAQGVAASVDAYTQTVWAGSNLPPYYRYGIASANKSSSDGIFAFMSGAYNAELEAITADAPELFRRELGFDPAADTTIPAPGEIITTNIFPSVTSFIGTTMIDSIKSQSPMLTNYVVRVQHPYGAFVCPGNWERTEWRGWFPVYGVATIESQSGSWSSYTAIAGGVAASNPRTETNRIYRCALETAAGNPLTVEAELYATDPQSGTSSWIDLSSQCSVSIVSQTVSQGDRVVTLDSGGTLRVSGVDVSGWGEIPMEQLAYGLSSGDGATVISATRSIGSMDATATTYAIIVAHDFDTDLKPEPPPQ